MMMGERDQMSPLPAARGATRRGLLAGGGAVAFVGLSAAALKLPFFSVEGAQVEAASCVGTDVSSTDKRLIISNWPAYIDPRRKKTSTQSVFTDTFGIQVDYTDDVNDNSEFYAKVKNQLGSCQPVKRDLMVLTDWMAARMINLGWIQELNPSAIPNVTANIIDPLRGLAWDPDFRHHVPWQSGLTGIAYNSDAIDEVGSFEDLLTRRDLRGRISLLTEMRDTMGFLLGSWALIPASSTTTTGTTPSTGFARWWPTGRCARSPATSTSRTWQQATSWPARRGPAMSSRPRPTTRRSSS